MLALVSASKNDNRDSFAAATQSTSISNGPVKEGRPGRCAPEIHLENSARKAEFFRF
jgi:hypothetical protein